MSFFDFLNTKAFHKERAEEVLEKLLQDEFIYQLQQDNTLSIISASGAHIVSNAITMDKKRNSLIIAEQTPDGQIILERNDLVTIVTQANRDHEVFSFNSKVSNIILDNGDILYEVIIPQRLTKGQRRAGFRVNLDTLSQVQMTHSVYEGQVSNLSSRGVLLTLEGYWPESIEKNNNAIACHISLDFMEFDCHIDVRYINFEAYPGRRTFIGGQIKNIQPLYQHQLDNFLAIQQRNDQRNKADCRMI